MPAIRAERLGKHFEGAATPSLRDFDVTIEPGEYVAVIGRSGAGKSTLLRLLNGMQRPTSGRLEVLGRDVAALRGRALRELRREIGFVFQQFHLLKNLTASQNVLCGRAAYASWWRLLSGCYSGPDRARARDALEAVGLGGRGDEAVRVLSGGQQQRVAIARALVQEPKMLLADEPMASLDPKLSEMVLDILSEANRRHGITVVVNLHVLELARKYARRILGLRQGRLVFDGQPAQLTPAAVETIYEA